MKKLHKLWFFKAKCDLQDPDPYNKYGSTQIRIRNSGQNNTHIEQFLKRRKNLEL